MEAGVTLSSDAVWSRTQHAVQHMCNYKLQVTAQDCL